LVGLFAPPLLASVAVGAAAGAVVGKFAGSKVTEEIQAKVSENLKPGTAVVIGVFPAEQRLEVERALPGSALKSVVESDEKGIDELKRALGEAMGKFAPDRTVLPIPDRAFGGVAGRSIADSVADWSIIAPVKPPEGAPNVLVVLIDDAGFGSIESFGGPVRSPAFTRVQEMGLTYNAFHVTAVCSPTRAALLTGRNHHRVGMGSIVEYPGPFPGYTGALPKSCAPFPRVLKENGYVTGGFGKWHLTPSPNKTGCAWPGSRKVCTVGSNGWNMADKRLVGLSGIPVGQCVPYMPTPQSPDPRPCAVCVGGMLEVGVVPGYGRCGACLD
jgi:arylsulfatase